MFMFVQFSLFFFTLKLLTIAMIEKAVAGSKIPPVQVKIANKITKTATNK